MLFVSLGSDQAKLVKLMGGGLSERSAAMVDERIRQVRNHSHSENNMYFPCLKSFTNGLHM